MSLPQLSCPGTPKRFAARSSRFHSASATFLLSGRATIASIKVSASRAKVRNPSSKVAWSACSG